METHIKLSANNKAELNTLIYDQLKAGYQIKGAMYANDKGGIQQDMVLPNNIDGEMTLAAGLKLAIGLTIYIAILYYFLA